MIALLGEQYNPTTAKQKQQQQLPTTIARTTHHNLVAEAWKGSKIKGKGGK